MDEATFWNVIDTAVRDADGDMEQAEESLLRDLSSREPAAIEHFQQILQSKLDDAYLWDLWGAAYIINGGCSDDSFEYFRCWLISRGRAVYEAAIANPDSSADLASPGEFESLLYVALRAYEKVAGSKMPRRPRVPLREPKGIGWDFDDSEQCASRLPRLSSLFG